MANKTLQNIWDDPDDWVKKLVDQTFSSSFLVSFIKFFFIMKISLKENMYLWDTGIQNTFTPWYFAKFMEILHLCSDDLKGQEKALGFTV